MLSPVRRFLPPVIEYTKQRLIRILNPPLLEYAPNGWSTVLEAGTEGWNSHQFIAEEKKKWGVFCDLVKAPGPLGFSHEENELGANRNVSYHNLHITYGYVLALASCQKFTLTVLDYGGGLGHFFQLGRSLLPDLELKFHCKEMPAVAETGKVLNPDVDWYVDDSCLQKTYDLVMISASLQYMKNWQEQLSAIASSANEYLFLIRIPVVSQSDSFVSIQKAYGTKMLHWQFNKSQLINHIQKAGFELIREFIVGDRPYIKGAPEQCELGSWLFRKIK